MTKRKEGTALVCFQILCFWVVAASAQAEDDAGRILYQGRCANCHGTNGWGDEEKRVPAIAGLPAAYILRQIEAFRSDLRHETRMHREAVIVEGDLAAAATIIAGMIPFRPILAGPADATNGEKILRELCAECHGPQGEGRAERGAPPLTGFQSWYVVDQVWKFRDFVRQGDAESLDSLKMHAIAYKTVSAEDVEDVAAYLAKEAERTAK